MSTFHRFKYFTLGHFHILNLAHTETNAFSLTVLGELLCSAAADIWQPQPECPAAAREQVMDERHQSTLSQVTMPTLGCGVWHHLPLLLGRDFLLTQLQAAMCIYCVQYFRLIFQAWWRAEVPGASTGKWWSPQCWWAWLGKCSPSPVKSQQASAGRAASFGVK